MNLKYLWNPRLGDYYIFANLSATEITKGRSKYWIVPGIISCEAGIWSGWIPSLKGCATFGASPEDTAKRLEACLETWIRACKEAGTEPEFVNAEGTLDSSVEDILSFFVGDNDED